jgi:hypothetical protein
MKRNITVIATTALICVLAALYHSNHKVTPKQIVNPLEQRIDSLSKAIGLNKQDIEHHKILLGSERKRRYGQH